MKESNLLTITSLFTLLLLTFHLTSSIGHTSGAFFFVWTLLAIGVTSLFSVILSVRGLWRLRRGSAGT